MPASLAGHQSRGQFHSSSRATARELLEYGGINNPHRASAALIKGLLNSPVNLSVMLGAYHPHDAAELAVRLPPGLVRLATKVPVRDPDGRS